VPKFIMNSQYPGGQLNSLRLVPTGVAFEVAVEDEPHGPRNTWIPVDESAKQWFKDWNRDHPEPNMQRKPYPLNRSHLPPQLRDLDLDALAKGVTPVPPND
jgi:hypothetical protein